MSPQIPRENPKGVIPSAEGHEAASEAFSPVSAPFPAVWWSKSAGEWFHRDPDHGLMAVGAMGSLADSLPRDAQRLVPVRPLLELVAELATRQAECVRDDADDAAFAYGHAVRLLASLLPESPARQDGDRG